MSTLTKLDYAQKAREMGFYVFPLQNRGKRPRTENGVDDATNDPVKIEGWWRQWPEANIGITSPDKRFVIVDLDTTQGNDGPGSFRIATGIPFAQWLIETFVMQTRSGGFQIYFDSGGVAYKNSVGLFPGVDIRSEGGYGIFAGSTVDADEKYPHYGEYKTYADNPIAPLPEGVRVLLKAPTEKSDKAHAESAVELDLPVNIDRARDYLKVRKPAIADGTGNTQTLKTFYDLRDLGLSMDVAVELVMEPGGWNERCEPPWDEEELVRDHMPYGPAHNAYAYPSKQQGSTASIFDQFTSQFMMPAEEMEAEVKKAMEAAGHSALKKAERWKTDDFETNEPRRKHALATTKGGTIIREWFPDRGLTIVLGIRGTGKTAFLMDVGMTLACDMQWHGNPTKTGWNVLYMAGEDEYGAREMQEAWKIHHCQGAAEGRFIFVPKIIRLNSDQDVIAAHEAVRSLIKGPTAVMYDTWQRGITGLKKNEGEEMQGAVDNAVNFATLLGGPALGAFHPPKNATKLTAAGAGEQENSSHAIIILDKKSTGDIEATVDRIKGDKDGSKLLFRLSTIKIADDDGYKQERRSVYVGRSGGTTTPLVGTASTPTEAVAYGSPEWCVAIARGIKALAERGVNIESINKLRTAFKESAEDTSFIALMASNGIAKISSLGNQNAKELENLWTICVKEKGVDLKDGVNRLVVCDRVKSGGKGFRIEKTGNPMTNETVAQDDGEGMEQPAEPVTVVCDDGTVL